MRRTTIGVAVAPLMISACGGGDDDSTSSDQPANEPVASEPASEPAEQAADQPATENGDSSDQAAPSNGLAENTAVVTLGDQTYTFDVTPGATARCDPNFDEPPNASVKDRAAELEWIANSDYPMAGVEPGSSQVDSFTVDGRYASGTATFVDLNASYAFQGGRPRTDSRHRHVRSALCRGVAIGWTPSRGPASNQFNVVTPTRRREAFKCSHPVPAGS